MWPSRLEESALEEPRALGFLGNYIPPPPYPHSFFTPSKTQEEASTVTLSAKMCLLEPQITMRVQTRQSWVPHCLSSFSFQLGQKDLLWNEAASQLPLNLPSLPAVVLMERV